MLKYLCYPSHLKIASDNYFNCKKKEFHDSKKLFDKNNILYDQISKDNIVWFNKKMELEKLWNEKIKICTKDCNQSIVPVKNYKLKYGSVLLHSTDTLLEFISITSIIAIFGFIFYLIK
jgi:ribonuclease HII